MGPVGAVTSGLLDLLVGGAGQIFGSGRDHDCYRGDDCERDVDQEWLRHLAAEGSDEHRDRQVARCVVEHTMSRLPPVLLYSKV